MRSAFDVISRRLVDDAIRRHVILPIQKTPIRKQSIPHVTYSTASPMKIKAQLPKMQRLLVKDFNYDGKNDQRISKPAPAKKREREKSSRNLTPTVAKENRDKTPRIQKHKGNCLVFYGSGPILRYKGNICRLVIYAADIDICEKNAVLDCEWLDVPPLAGKRFKSMNSACEAIRACIKGPHPLPRKRWTANIWTNLTLTAGGTTLETHKQTDGNFQNLLQPFPAFLKAERTAARVLCGVSHCGK